MTRWVVVGAGAAGCVVASRLSEVAGNHVTLIEAGSGSPGRESHDAGFFDAMAEPGRLFPGPFARGRGLGGSSAVNGMIATPGDLAQYESWGWFDAEDAFARIRVPLEIPTDEELGPMDRFLLAAAPDAAKARLTRRNGRRVTAAEAYLPGTSVDVVGESEVASISFTGRRATGVQLADGRSLAADEVVVAAGAIGSPLLLAASDVDVPGVGQDLQNHVGLPITVRLREPGGDSHALVAGSLLRRGDLQLFPVNYAAPDRPDESILLVVVMTPTGRGAVTAGDAGGAGVHQQIDDHDRALLVAGVALAHEVLDHPAVRSQIDDIRVGDAPELVFHPTSTCRMGVVVDDDGAVVGYEALHVVDASVFPSIPHANTYLPTLMVAERLAARLVARR
ncbi:MAG: GMC oxidoreductase [Ilumatobacteraceae bacterium]